MSNSNPQDPTNDEVCYRHPDRESGVSCQRCDRFICGDCRRQASVGVHCPECSKGTTQRVYDASTLPGVQDNVTKALVGINVAIFIATIALLGSSLSGISREVVSDYGTFAPFIAENVEWWRIISGGFLHSGLLHVGFNMYLLWKLGPQIERAIGAKSYLAVYFASLVGGSFGALLLSPESPVVGASGAVFGLIGFTVIMYRSHGIGLFDSGLGFLVLINALYSFRGGVSLGGHAGGFFIGLLLGAMFFGASQGAKPPLGGSESRQIAASLAIGVSCFAAAIWASSLWENPLF